MTGLPQVEHSPSPPVLKTSWAGGSLCRVSRSTHVRPRPEDDGRVLLYNPRTDELHMLGPIEALVFNLCDGRSIGHLIAAVKDRVTESGVSRESVPAEILDLLRQFCERGLIDLGQVRASTESTQEQGPQDHP